MSIATKLQTVYDGVEDVRDALKEIDINLGRGTIDTLGDDIRTLSAGGTGYGVKVYGDVRTEEEVEIEDPDTHETSTETEYTYTRSLILDSVLAAQGDDLNTDVIDGIGELDGDMVDLPAGKVQIPLNTGVKLEVEASKVFVKFRDPIVEDIVLSHWGTDGKITLAQVRAITKLGTYFQNTAIKTFDELKWFDGLDYTHQKGTDDSNYAFSRCSSLTSIKLPRVQSLGIAPFNGCTSLTHIELPDTLTDLGRTNAYQTGYFGGTLIEELIIPDSVTMLSTDAFRDMPELKRIIWGSNLPFPKQGDSGYPLCQIINCPKLERIENLPDTFNTENTRVSFSGDGVLDFSNILPLLTQISDSQLENNHHIFGNTKAFDYAINGFVEFPKLVSNSSNKALMYCFESASEFGFTASFPNWTVNPSFQRFHRVGKIIMSDSVTSLGNFAWNCEAEEIILPTTTPPTLSTTPSLIEQARIYVPSNALSSYLADASWSQVSSKIKAYIDPSTAQFCSIPSVAPVPSDYTKVDYISNIDGDGNKNCQISNMGYTPKRYSQYLFDLAHKHVRDVSYTESLSVLFGSGSGNANDLCIVLDSRDICPRIYRPRSSNEQTRPNPMGITLHQWWSFNSNVTGEKFGQRSTLKLSYKWIEYHGLRHQVDENTGDASENFSLLRYNNNEQIGRQVKIYRFCIFEPVANAADYDDPANYEIVRDYIPAMRNSDGVYGLYERLTDTFYPSTRSDSPFSGPAYE